MTSIKEFLQELRPIRIEDFLGEHQSRPLATLGSYALLNNALRVGIRFASSIALSRLLAPETFGLLAILLAFQGILLMLNGQGFTESAVREKTIRIEQLNAVFWLNAALGIALGSVMAIAGPVFASFFREPTLAYLAPVLGGVIAVENAFSAHLIVLTRARKQEISIVINVVSLILEAVTAISLALLGLSVWALMWGIIVAAVSKRLLIAYFIRWRPGRFQRGVGLRSMAKYGAVTTLNGFIFYLSNNLQTFALGRFAAPADIGFFNRGQTLFLTPMQQFVTPLVRVTFPIMSALQDDRKALVNLVCRVTWTICLLMLPLAAIFIAYGDWILIWLIGPAWSVSGEVVRWMAFASVPSLLTAGLSRANAAIGRPGRAMFVHTAGFPILFFGICYASQFGAPAVASFFAAFRWFIFFPILFVNLKGSCLGFRRVTISAIQLFAIFSAIAFLNLVVRILAEDSNLMVQLATVVSASLISLIIQVLAYQKFSDGRQVLSWVAQNFGNRIPLLRLLEA